MEEFASKLKRLRLAHGLTQAELAEKLYVSKQAVSKWETAKGMPDVELLPKIAAALGVDLNALMSDENADGNSDSAGAENSGNGESALNAEVRETAALNSGATADSEDGGNAINVDGAADNAAQRITHGNGGNARKPKGKGSRRLSKLIYICIPVLIVVIAAAVLLSVYLPDKSQGNDIPPVADAPVEKDPEPVFTEIRAVGEDYYKNSYIYKFTGADNSQEGKKKHDKAYYSFTPASSSGYTFTITTKEPDEYSKKYYSDAAVRFYDDSILAAQVSYGETLTYTKYMKSGFTYEFTVDMYNPYEEEIPYEIYDGAYHYIQRKMSFEMQVDYKHDFENIIVPYRSTYTVALRANDYIVKETDGRSSKIVSSVKTFKITNSNVLKITGISRMKILDPSMEQKYIRDSVNSYFTAIDDAGTSYIELLFRCPSYEAHSGAYYYDDEYNNDFYYLSISNNTWEDIPLEVEVGNVETLNCSSPLNIPSKEEGWGVNYRYYYLDASEIRKVDWSTAYAYFLVSIESFYPSNFFYDTDGNNRRRDEEYIDWDDDGWHSIKVYSFENCYIRVPISDTPYQIKIEPWKSNKS